MLYPRHLEEKLGFNEIRNAIRQACCGPSGEACVEQMQFSPKLAQVERFCRQTDEYVYMLKSGSAFSVQPYRSIDEYFGRIRVEGLFLQSEELHEIRLVLKMIAGAVSFLSEHDETYPLLFALVQKINIDTQIVRNIDICIDDSGLLKDNASPQLAKIRRDIYACEQKARKQLNSILGQSRKNGYVPDDAGITIRGGRLVIPLKAEYKRVVKGFVHDESASGNLVYIEPAEVLDTNNEIRELEYEQRREIIRILTMLTSLLRPYIEEISGAYQLFGKLDFIRAKAKITIQIDAITPEIRNDKGLDWKKARHPLLEQSLRKQGKDIVPLDIKLNHKQKILIISGPNAGGKSVCLKTVGLLQYMLQCGMPIPVMEGSWSGIFTDIFVDIGDEQSIESDLSTYSSHLMNMRQFVLHSGKNSLFLIDEFGTGTDPQFGGAIAEALLEKLHENKAYGLVTTHYSNLKKFADQTPGISNGRMRFDVAMLEPLYELEMGKPGSSFALEIASKIGFPREVLQNARKKVGVDQIQLDKLLNELEKEKQKFDRQNAEIEKTSQALNAQLAEYKKLKSILHQEKKTIITEAKRQASEILSQTNKKVENTIREIKEAQAEKVRTRQLRENLKRMEKELQPVEEEELQVEDLPELEEGAIEKGCFVRIKGQESVGEVLRLSKNQAEVAFGGIKTNLKIDRLERVSQTQARKFGRQQGTRFIGTNINLKKAEFSSDLDIRGRRAEEALGLITRFIDDALLFSMPNVRIIHGKGDGILRQMVRNELRSYKDIEGIDDEHADRGGAGISVITFRKL
ncbi:MAG: Smr/MutS family protein [Cyclobacteriaceae bacterium]|nr:Smr/MutS family protein [Cyclobacteriaceae bacterium]